MDRNLRNNLRKMASELSKEDLEEAVRIFEFAQWRWRLNVNRQHTNNTTPEVVPSDNPPQDGNGNIREPAIVDRTDTDEV